MKNFVWAACTWLIVWATSCQAQPSTDQPTSDMTPLDSSTPHLNTDTQQEVTRNGMKVLWQIIGDSLYVKMSAPTQGWVAIGFHTKPGLAGTQLIMASVSGAEVTLSDRFILAPGDHRAITELGGQSALRLISGKETRDSTDIAFMLPLAAVDQWHHDLIIGQSYHMLMAFSREDDFLHHSMMRTSIVISL